MGEVGCAAPCDVQILEMSSVTLAMKTRPLSDQIGVGSPNLGVIEEDRGYLLSEPSLSGRKGFYPPCQSVHQGGEI